MNCFCLKSTRVKFPLSVMFVLISKLTLNLIQSVASHLLDCHRVNDKMQQYIYDLCWMSKDTLIVGDWGGKQLVKYTIHAEARTCTGEVMDSGYQVQSVSCSQKGQVFVTEGKSGAVKVRIYDIITGYKEVWDTNITSRTTALRVSVNTKSIVISSDRDSFVYNKERVLQYKITHDQVSYSFWHTYLTDTGVFWGTASEGYKLLIMNLQTNETVISTDGIVKARCVSGIKNCHVYVTDVNLTDVGVYSPEGTFLHYLQIDPPEGGGLLWYIDTIGIRDSVSLVAFSTFNKKLPIAIYITF